MLSIEHLLTDGKFELFSSHPHLLKRGQILPIAPVTAMGAGGDDAVLGLRITKTCACANRQEVVIYRKGYTVVITLFPRAV